jgi:hypothetical protein
LPLVTFLPACLNHPPPLLDLSGGSRFRSFPSLIPTVQSRQMPVLVAPSRPHSAQMRVSSLMRPSARCRRPGPISFHDPVHASTSSSNDGSRRRSSCLLQRPPPCCSGPCWPLDRSTCARSMAGRCSIPRQSMSQLTSQLDQLPSMYRRFAPNKSDRLRDRTAFKVSTLNGEKTGASDERTFSNFGKRRGQYRVRGPQPWPGSARGLRRARERQRGRVRFAPQSPGNRRW